MAKRVIWSESSTDIYNVECFETENRLNFSLSPKMHETLPINTVLVQSLSIRLLFIFNCIRQNRNSAEDFYDIFLRLKSESWLYSTWNHTHSRSFYLKLNWITWPCVCICGMSLWVWLAANFCVWDQGVLLSADHHLVLSVSWAPKQESLQSC